MRKWFTMTAPLLCILGWQVRAHSQNSSAIVTAKIDPTQNLAKWDGCGSSLAWWGRAVGGTANADYYADLIYSTKSVDGYPGLGLGIDIVGVEQTPSVNFRIGLYRLPAMPHGNQSPPVSLRKFQGELRDLYTCSMLRPAQAWISGS